MPIYEYQCLDCGKKMEQLQKLNDPPLTVCPTCSGKLKKLISSPAFQFKGSGWYVTDYAGKKGAAAGEGGSSSAKSDASDGKGESQSDGKSEAKPAGKSEAGGGGDKADSKPKETSSTAAAKPSSAD
jgi:putative FmdB family regulatory protein